MVTLKTDQEFKWGQTNILPIIGATQIGADGTIKVKHYEDAVAIAEAGTGFYILGDPGSQDVYEMPESLKKQFDGQLEKIATLEKAEKDLFEKFGAVQKELAAEKELTASLKKEIEGLKSVPVEIVPEEVKEKKKTPQEILNEIKNKKTE